MPPWKEELRKFGADIESTQDTVTIRPAALHAPAELDSHNDHRIAMMAAVAAIACKEPVTILGAECVKKSYPHFWWDYTALGGEVHGLVSG